MPLSFDSGRRIRLSARSGACVSFQVDFALFSISLSRFRFSLFDSAHVVVVVVVVLLPRACPHGRPTMRHLVDLFALNNLRKETQKEFLRRLRRGEEGGN